MIVEALRKYIAFRRWLNTVFVDAGLLLPPQLEAPADRRRGAGPATARMPATETEERLAALERELAELRMATAAISAKQNGGNSPRSPKRELTAVRTANAAPQRAPRTLPRPHPRRLDARNERDGVMHALANTPLTGPSSTQREVTKPRAEAPAKKRAADLTRDEVAVSLLSRFGASPAPVRA